MKAKFFKFLDTLSSGNQSNVAIVEAIKRGYSICCEGIDPNGSFANRWKEMLGHHRHHWYVRPLVSDSTVEKFAVSHPEVNSLSDEAILNLIGMTTEGFENSYNMFRGITSSLDDAYEVLNQFPTLKDTLYDPTFNSATWNPTLIDNIERYMALTDGLSFKMDPHSMYRNEYSTNYEDAGLDASYEQ